MTLLTKASWDGQIYLGGTWTNGAAGSYPVVEPATGDNLGDLGQAGPGDVDTAVSKAGQVQRDWAAAPYDARARVLRRAGELWRQHAEEIHGWVIRESGAIGPFAHFQTEVAAEECYEAAALAAAPYGELLRSNQPRLSMARRLPVGVVGVIAPFNAPIILSIRAVAPALALGNAVVLKPDPRTGVSGGVVLARIFEEAGLPAGLLSVLPGGVDVGEALVDHPAVRVIAFTGSTKAGRAIAQRCAAQLKRAHLELGGNSALVVLDDVDVDHASSVGAFGSFNHAGQICMATSRHLVHEDIADAYAEALGVRAARLPVGDPSSGTVALGPLIDTRQRDNVHRIVTSTVDAGAQLTTGGSYDGLFYRPTVLSRVPTTAAAFTEEIFGPVAPVVPFSSTEHAAELAASTPYGLSLGILTGDVMKGLALAEKIPSGLVHINDQTVNDEALAPFGGVGDSGTGGRSGGAQANLEAFTEMQWVTIRDDLPTYPF